MQNAASYGKDIEILNVFQILKSHPFKKIRFVKRLFIHENYFDWHGNGWQKLLVRPI